MPLTKAELGETSRTGRPRRTIRKPDRSRAQLGSFGRSFLAPTLPASQPLSRFGRGFQTQAQAQAQQRISKAQAQAQAQLDALAQVQAQAQAQAQALLQQHGW